MAHKQFLIGIFWVFLFAGAIQVCAHCEIPCGIYDDGLRIKLMEEHVSTIEKSMQQVIALQGEKPVEHNQLVRWVMNKDDHADKIQEIVSRYFMTQRIKADDPACGKKLAILHQILVKAMKCKQTTDLSHIKALRTLLKEFHGAYFGPKHK